MKQISYGVFQTTEWYKTVPKQLNVECFVDFFKLFIKILALKLGRSKILHDKKE